jgi:hypothetical protein
VAANKLQAKEVMPVQDRSKKRSLAGIAKASQKLAFRRP